MKHYTNLIESGCSDYKYIFGKAFLFIQIFKKNLLLSQLSSSKRLGGYPEDDLIDKVLDRKYQVHILFIAACHRSRPTHCSPNDLSVVLSLYDCINCHQVARIDWRMSPCHLSVHLYRIHVCTFLRLITCLFFAKILDENYMNGCRKELAAGITSCHQSDAC